MKFHTFQLQIWRGISTLLLISVVQCEEDSLGFYDSADDLEVSEEVVRVIPLPNSELSLSLIPG